MDDRYDGTEQAVAFADLRSVQASPTAIVPPALKEPVSPIVDETTGDVVGFRSPGTVWRVYDIEGRFVTMGELPLEASMQLACSLMKISVFAAVRCEIDDAYPEVAAVLTYPEIAKPRTMFEAADRMRSVGRDRRVFHGPNFILHHKSSRCRGSVMILTKIGLS